MKIRTSFVSNSSSTSFCIYGISTSSSKDLPTEVETTLNDLGLNCYYEPYNDTIYIGMSLTKIKDNETFAQFKERVEKIFAKSGLPKETISGKYEVIEDSWYDG